MSYGTYCQLHGNYNRKKSRLNIFYSGIHKNLKNPWNLRLGLWKAVFRYLELCYYFNMNQLF